MKLYSKILGLTCALIVASASSALAVTHIQTGDTHTSHTGENYVGPEVFFTEADRLSHRTQDQAQRVSVMIKKVGNPIEKIDDVKTASEEEGWFLTSDSDNDIEEIIYINEAAPEVDSTLWQASDIFEDSTDVYGNKQLDRNNQGITGGMRPRGDVLEEGRYALFIGSSHDLESNEDDDTIRYVEYFNVYEDGSTKSIGMKWKEKKTGAEMAALKVEDCEAAKAENQDKYCHVAFIADIYGKDEDDAFGMIFSYTGKDGIKAMKAVYPAAAQNIEINGEASMRFGIEICMVPIDYMNSFEAEGLIIPGGATATE